MRCLARGGAFALGLVALLGCNNKPTTPTETTTSVGSPKGTAAASPPQAPGPILSTTTSTPAKAVSAAALAAVTLKGLPTKSLSLGTQHEVSLDLHLPGGETFGTANVGTLLARLPGGKIRSLPVSANGQVKFQPKEPGGAMLAACAGPPVKGRSDAWQWVTHCTKTVLRVGNLKDGAPALDAAFTAKLGTPVEIVPFTSPLKLRVGDELPVRVYSLLGPRGNTEVVAVRPDGSADRQISNRGAMARFKLTAPGRWLIRYVDTQPDIERTAELVFEIPGGAR